MDDMILVLELRLGKVSSQSLHSVRFFPEAGPKQGISVLEAESQNK